RLSENQLRLAMDAVEMGTWHRNIRTGEIVWSDHIGPILGLPLKNKIENIEEFIRAIHPEDRAKFYDLLNQSHSGEIFSEQYRVVWPNGEVRWLESQGKGYFDPSGNLVQTAGTVRDITAQKEMELALQAERSSLAEGVKERTAELIKVNRSLLIRQQRAEALYEFAQVILETTDADHLLQSAAKAISAILPADRVLVYLLDPANQAVINFAKAGPGAETTPQVPYEELAVGLTGWVIRELQAALSPGGVPDPRESEIVQQRRRSVTAGATMVVPMPLHEKILGTITAVNPPDGPDFTEDDLEMVQSMANQTAVALKNISLADSLRQRSEALRLANLELERGARLKDEFLANMSHELRTPLNAILGMSELLTKHIYGELNAKQARAVNHIDEGGQHLLELINDILDISKIEAGMLELTLNKVAVADISEASLRFILSPALKKAIKIIPNIEPSLGFIEVDERRFKQILVNLLYNAVKFTPEGGQVGLDVSCDPENKDLLFSVWDTGIGISQADQQRLFQPFVQLDSRLAREHEGTGLGLALVSRLTELHGGTLHLQSELDSGSRFTIKLPCELRTSGDTSSLLSADATESAESSIACSLPFILLAEDNDANSVFITDGLQSQGYRVTRVRNGREAVKQARKHKPGLILMDIQMPGMDGLEAMKQIRADEDAQVAQIPIIGLTALAMSGDREHILSAGANAYLSKPVKLNNLFELVEQLLLHPKTN
ncbi:MAG: response regulator, partial [Anaerolineales bacterium]|nr:response regulator [Anaerolineales bacterium]